MADPELLQALDYILNRSDESSIEVLAEAVVRRRRNISMFDAVGNMPDPQRMAKELTDKIDSGIGIGLEDMRRSIQEMMLRIIKEHAPELSDKQIDELCQAWLPDGGGKNKDLPREMLASMIEQFISFSRGTMKESVDKELRKEMGSWPERYWKIFPPVVCQIITDFLKDKITEKDFNSKINIALN
jgi:hypothetical protein